MADLAKRPPSLEARAMLASLSRIDAPNTRAAYASDVAQYLEFCARKGCALAEGLPAWREELRAKGHSVPTINRKLSAVKRAVRAATAKAEAPVRAAIEATLTAAKPIKQVRGAIRQEKMLTPEEILLLLARMSERGRGFVRFLYATGCRVSEMVGIRLTDCQTNGGVTIEVTGKGNKARRVRLPEELYKELRETYGGSTWLFETGAGTQYRREYVSNMIERASKRALGRMVGAHALRHSAATALIAATGKVQAVSEYLGHADPSTTLRFYAHQRLDDAELSVLDVRVR